MSRPAVEGAGGGVEVGAVRAAIAGYIIPIVALVLGVIVLDEQIELIQVAGVAVVLSGGYLLSRGQYPAH